MSEFTFRLEQEDADEFSLLIEDGAGCTWRVPNMRTADAVGLYKAVSAGIGDYVAEMERARREYQLYTVVDEALGYALDDPKHPTYHDRMAGIWDDRDKTAGAA